MELDGSLKIFHGEISESWQDLLDEGFITLQEKISNANPFIQCQISEWIKKSIKNLVVLNRTQNQGKTNLKTTSNVGTIALNSSVLSRIIAILEYTMDYNGLAEVMLWLFDTNSPSHLVFVLLSCVRRNYRCFSALNYSQKIFDSVLKYFRRNHNTASKRMLLYYLTRYMSSKTVQISEETAKELKKEIESVSVKISLI